MGGWNEKGVSGMMEEKRPGTRWGLLTRVGRREWYGVGMSGRVVMERRM